MTETETVRAWLTAQRETLQQQILDLQCYREGINWLLKQLSDEPLFVGQVEFPPPTYQWSPPNTPSPTLSKRQAVESLLSVAPHGLSNAEACTEMEKLGVSISSGHMGAILSQMATAGTAKLNTKTRRYQLVVS